MAYRRRTHRKKSSPRRRSRRMGAIRLRRDGVQRTLGLIGGAVLTGVINNMIPDTTKDGKPFLGEHGKAIIAAGEVVLGYLLPGFVKSDLFAGVGDGMIAAGGLNLLHEVGVIKGIPTIAGWRELHTVNGPGKGAEQRSVDSSNVAYMYAHAYGRAADE